MVILQPFFQVCWDVIEDGVIKEFWDFHIQGNFETTLMSHSLINISKAIPNVHHFEVGKKETANLHRATGLCD